MKKKVKRKAKFNRKKNYTPKGVNCLNKNYVLLNSPNYDIILGYNIGL